MAYGADPIQSGGYGKDPVEKTEPKTVSTGQRFLETAEPYVESAGAIAGGILGTPADIAAGPLGTVAGSALGYATARGGMRALKQALGYEPTLTIPEAAKYGVSNLMTGAEYEMGGQALPEALRAGIAGGRYFTEAGRRGAQKIATEAFGGNLKQAREILRGASKDLTASQALSAIDPKTGEVVLNAPTAQALLLRAQSRDPEFFTKFLGKQEADNLAVLQQIAGGKDQTAARQAQEQLKRQLNERLIPKLQAEMNAANIGGQMLPTLKGMETQAGERAAKSVEDVRRMVAAGGRAEARAADTVPVPGMPRVPGRYTYMGELANKADKVADEAAKGSLRFGQARDFAAAAREQLQSLGLKELTGDSIAKSIRAKLSDPSIAGNRDIETALNQVSKDVQKWTKSNGVIDAWALDSIRKNSVNSVIQRLYPAASSQSQKNLAAKVIESIKPKIIDAIEDAGGTGYRQYLTDYAAGAQKIDQAKLGAKLMDLYQNNPKEFVRWVEGNAPEQVEEIFGPGQYNVIKELSNQRAAALKGVSRSVQSQMAAEEQAKAGARRLQDVLQTNIGFPRVPNLLSRKVTTTNAVLDLLEDKVSKKTMSELVEASKSAKNLEELLAGLPPKTRSEVISKLPEKIPTKLGTVLPLAESTEE